MKIDKLAIGISMTVVGGIIGFVIIFLLIQLFFAFSWYPIPWIPYWLPQTPENTNEILYAVPQESIFKGSAELYVQTIENDIYFFSKINGSYEFIEEIPEEDLGWLSFYSGKNGGYCEEAWWNNLYSKKIIDRVNLEQSGRAFAQYRCYILLNNGRIMAWDWHYDDLTYLLILPALFALVSAIIFIRVGLREYNKRRDF